MGIKIGGAELRLLTLLPLFIALESPLTSAIATEGPASPGGSWNPNNAQHTTVQRRSAAHPGAPPPQSENHDNYIITHYGVEYYTPASTDVSRDAQDTHSSLRFGAPTSAGSFASSPGTKGGYYSADVIPVDPKTGEELKHASPPNQDIFVPMHTGYSLGTDEAPAHASNTVQVLEHHPQQQQQQQHSASVPQIKAHSSNRETNPPMSNSMGSLPQPHATLNANEGASSSSASSQGAAKDVVDPKSKILKKYKTKYYTSIKRTPLPAPAPFATTTNNPSSNFRRHNSRAHRDSVEQQQQQQRTNVKRHVQRSPPMGYGDLDFSGGVFYENFRPNIQKYFVR